MQNIVIDKPYRFVRPSHSHFWPKVMRGILNPYLRKVHGLESCTVSGIEKLNASFRQGHGILLTPNHCRPCDPMVMEFLLRDIRCPHYTMASWHLFMQSRMQAWILPRLNVFSVYREGMDGASVKEAISILKEAKGPLTIFPEGLISRSNEALRYLNEGPAFMALSAAKQRMKQNPTRRVVIHPVVLRYSFSGDLEKSVTPVLSDLEARLSWTPDPKQSLVDRITRIGVALLGLKETEYLGRPQEGSIPERLSRLINHILDPLEKEWRTRRTGDDVPGRVRALRCAILPEMAIGQVTEEERARRWRQLGDLYLAQQLSLYPPDYLISRPTAERVLETVERFEEDLTDVARVHRPWHARIVVDDAIVADPERYNPAELTEVIRQRLESRLSQTAEMSALLNLNDGGVFR